MFKFILVGFLVCVGGAILFALYAAYRITKMGQVMGGRGTSVDPRTGRNGYITTTGTTLHEPDALRPIESSSFSEDPREGTASGVGIGEAVADSALDFGSIDGSAGDTGSWDSGGDSGSSDSGGGDSGGGSSD